YASRAEPSSCLLPVLFSICAPVTLPVCLSIVTNTTPFPVSPCFAHSGRYSGFGVIRAFGGATARAGLADWACSEERETSVTIRTRSNQRIMTPFPFKASLRESPAHQSPATSRRRPSVTHQACHSVLP